MSQGTKPYDLEERTAKFGENVIKFCNSVKRSDLIWPLVIQLLRAGTSIGTNYMEANGAASSKDFRNKIFICKKESQEVKHWTRMLSISLPERTEELRVLWKEAQELTMIFQKIVSTLRDA